MEKTFEDLRQRCEKNLARVAPEDKDVPAICKEVLASSSFSPSPSEITHPCLWESEYQHYKNNEFSYFPLTLWSNGNFHLDLYVWMKGRTGIHDHHFHGAFKVLRGDYSQTIFDYTSEKVIEEGVEKGRLSRRKHQTLKRGDIHHIHTGESFIHSVFHETDFCLTLSLRSKDLIPHLNSYFLPGFKVIVKGPAGNNKRKLEYLWLLVMHENKEMPLPQDIPLYELINFSEVKVKSSEELDKWWNYLGKNRQCQNSQLIKNALFKTKML